MRILKIRFCNLNSLAGEWEVDLTDPAYRNEGLFAITGPTGAGKSTLLDAICLALYGRTPRQANVSKSQNEVMSRQTGECFAEVEFETPQGRWRVHWSQHRSRRLPDGALQQPKQEIIEVDSGKVLHTRIRDVAETIERLTGMDFDRFTRSMLLAQGGFAAFLQADPDARAPILEQITGTSIYSEISIAVHRRRAQEKQTLEQLQAAQSGLQLLSDEDETLLSRELAQVGEAVHEQQTALEQQQRLLEWRSQLERETRRSETLAQQRAELDQALDAFAPAQAQLQQALDAQALRADYEPLQQRRRDLEQARQTLEQLRQGLPTLEQTSEDSAAQLAQARQGVEQAQAQLTRQQPLIARLREQDWQVRAQQQTVQQLQQQLPAQLLAEPAPDPARLEAEITATEQAIVETLGANTREQLVEQLEQIRSRGETLAELKRLVQQAEELADERAELDKAEAALQQQSRELEADIEQRTQQLEALQREQQDLAKMQRLADRIASLEQQRHELEAGKPCPLCGATEHPWQREAPPEMSAERARLQTVEQALATLQPALQKQQLRRAELSAEMRNRVQQRQQNQTRRAALDAPIAGCLQALDWGTLPASQQVISAHQEAGSQWQALNTRLRQLDALEARQKQQREERERQRQRLEWDRARAELARQQALRAELSPEPDTDAFEQRLQQALNAARQALEQAQQREADSRQALERRRQQLLDEQARIDRLDQQLGGMQEAFSAALRATRFADEAALTAALLPTDQLQALQQQAQSLREREAELNGLLRHNRETLEALRQQALTTESTEQLTARQQQLKQHLDQLLEKRGSLQQQLSRNSELKRRFGEQQQAIEAQQRELSRWDQLHELIGSADGKKFRNFAQGLTFELMVGHANRQLQKMSDRYLLTRDGEQPLELNVIDNYQAGEVRSTKNLSGGESFLISLALALGLSSMASRNVRVDSLFLDEGFGTLDEDALETALDTLAGLQQEGKLIGVISHVQALKERIGTRIEVQPLSGGRSRILGPGCRPVG